MQGVTFLLLLLAILLLPGFALSQVKFLSKIEWVQQSRFLFSIGFSYSLFALTLGAFQATQLGWVQFTLVFSCIVFLSLGLLLHVSFQFFKTNNLVDEVKANLAPLAIVAAVFCYHELVGPYTEIPADIYAHMEYFQQAVEVQNQGFLGENKGAEFFRQKGLVWYHLLAFCSKVSGTSVDVTVYVTTLLTKTLFLLSVYFFSLRIFDNAKQSKSIAVLATFFVAAHMGINVMAYIRYYSFAPTMLNFALYFSAIVAFLKLLKTACVKKVIVQGGYIAFLLLGAAAIHTQEALFMLIMFGLITLTFVVLPLESQVSLPKSVIRYLPKLLLALILIGFSAAYIIARNNLSLAPNVGWRLWEFGAISDWLPNITTLNFKYQFMRVVTLWGLLVYVAAIIYWRDIKTNIYLVAGLISPIFTLANPFFVDLFLRVGNSTTLWRMSYLVPIYFVAAFLVIKVIENCRSGDSLSIKKVFGIAFIVLSFILLLPLKNTYAGLHYSRVPTLAAVESENSYIYLEDVINELNNIEDKHVVLTDPVTGYVVSAMTHHHSYRKKFFASNYIKFSFKAYSKRPLRKHKGKLLLINSRESASSRVGALAKHWPSNILDVSQYYSPELMQHIQRNPSKFALHWQSKQGDILLYKVL